MKLIVNELKDTLFQEITPEQNTQVEAIRINLIKFNNPAGNFTVEVHDSNGGLIGTSADSFSASSMSPSSFFHGMIRFNINVQLKKNTPYRIVLKATGYTFSESAYIGWISGYDLEIYPPSYTTTGSFSEPLSLEIWNRI